MRKRSVQTPDEVVAPEIFVSPDIRDGEFVVLLHLRGCGKTTFLRSIAGITDPDAGSIHLGERDIVHVALKIEYRHGLSILCTVSAHDGGKYRGSRPENAQSASCGIGTACESRAELVDLADWRARRFTAALRWVR